MTMLRGWDNLDNQNPFQDAPESPNGDLLSHNEVMEDQQQEQSGNEVKMLRDWTDAGERDEEKVEEEEEDDDDDECDEIGIDPLASPFETSSVGGSVSGWSIAPGAVDRNSFIKPYDYENQDDSSAVEREKTSTSPRAGRSTKTSLSMSKDEQDQMTSSPGATMFDDIDLEALANTIPSSSNDGYGGRRRNDIGSWTTRFLRELRVNPTSKFKLIAGASVLLVVTCLVAIAATLSTGKKHQNRPRPQVEPYNSVGAPILVFTETSEPTDIPTFFPTSSPPSGSPLTKHPTGSPSYLPTLEPSHHPTTKMTTVNPTDHPTTLTPTYYPTMNPITYSPTMDCSDTDGEWMTYNDKPRDCIWLDNDHNGAQSDRKDMNCLDSELGEKCRYTCRLYNGCMDYLLSAISDYTETKDISIGDSCADRDGLFLSHGGIPRNCTWLSEDPDTAPMKKNLNCGGDPNTEQTELGAMCPAACAGYNECQVTESGEIRKVEPAPQNDDLVDETEDVEDIADGDFTRQQNLALKMQNSECKDEDGMWLNHMGKYRQCRWFFTDEFEVEEKKRMNCGITEIGQRCKGACCTSLEGPLSGPGLDTGAIFTDAVKEEVIEKEEGCFDEEGEWYTHDEKLRQCRWLALDGEISSEAKKLLNCGQTQIGFKCRETCGCSDIASLEGITKCEDKKGLWQTHERDEGRTCEWMDRKFGVERRELNCGKTEIGVMCQCKCSEPFVEDVGNLPVDPMLPEQHDQTTSYAVTQANFFDGLREKVEEQTRCADEEGEWLNHDGNWRQCRWLALDGEISSEAKKLLNCGQTQIGFKCRETCGCSDIASLEGTTKCEDKKGLWQTHERDEGRTCEWMDRKFGVERRELNCGKTEIGVMCQCKCSEPFVEAVDSTLQETGVHTSFVDASQVEVTENTCTDDEGEWLNNDNKLRQCRWLNLGNAEARKFLNCGKTEIGLRCRATCGCSDGAPLATRTTCEDIKGEWKTNEGDTRTCEWMDRRFPRERRQNNCGITEIGVMCQCKCLELIQDEHDVTGVGDFIPLVDSASPEEPAVISLRKHQGRLDETGKIMTIVAMADATVSQRNEKENFGDSPRLYVDSSLDAEIQALILFDLSYVEQSINAIGSAMLHIYAQLGSPVGGVEFKKMSGTDFRQGNIKWGNMPGDGEGEPTIAFLDEVVDETWYEVDVTAAVKDAFLNGESRLGIRVISTESHFTFGSKDTDKYQPTLVIDSTTKQPTSAPTPQPTHYPTASPVITLDCMDSKGFFITHTGESQSCSWFDIGNGEQKKELNCKGDSDAAIFCQSKCSAFNGCDSLTCDDKSGSYLSHTGWSERCSWLLTGAGTLKLEQNCGTSEYPITELGKRCQATCAGYNECGIETIVT